MSQSPPKIFDRAQVAQHRNRASSAFGEYAFLKERESIGLIERIEDVSRHFDRVLDLGGHIGTTAKHLTGHPQVGEVVSADLSPRMVESMLRAGLNAQVVDEEALPFAPDSFDLVTSVLSLHWVNDLPGALIQIRNCLKADGLFLGCMFGGGTLSELRTALVQAESEVTGGVSPRVSPLPGLQDMAGLLQRAGFALPVADVERVTVRYDNALKLMGDLKGMGEQAAFVMRPDQSRRGLSRRILARANEIYAEQFSDRDGRIRASFEIVWLSGWVPHENQPKPLKPGSARMSLADAVNRAAKDKN